MVSFKKQLLGTFPQPACLNNYSAVVSEKWQLYAIYNLTKNSLQDVNVLIAFSFHSQH